MSITENYSKLFFFTCILLQILVHTCTLLYSCVLLYIVASFCNIFLYTTVSYCVFMFYCKKSARIMGLEGFMCFEASLPGLRKQRGGWGGRSPPPFANTTFASLVWKGYSYALKQACPALKNSGGFEGGGRPPPHLQTQCSHHGFGRDSYALKKLARRQTNKKYALCIMNSISKSSIYTYMLCYSDFVICLRYYTILCSILLYATIIFCYTLF